MHRLTLLLAGATLALPALASAAPEPAPAQPAPAQTTAVKPQIQKVPEVTRIFPDVPEDHWAAAAVHRLAVTGVIEGDPTGRFRGDAPITRYEFAAAIARILNYPVCFPPPLSPQPNAVLTPEPKIEPAPPQQAPASPPQ